MTEHEREMIQFPLSILNQVGLLNVNKSSTIVQKYFPVLFGLLLLVAFFSALLQYFYIKNDVFDFIENSEAFGGVFQVFTKLVCFIYYKEKFRNLIKLSNQFLSTEKCTKSLKKEVESVSQKIIIFQKIYFYAVLVFSPSFFVTTFFGKKLPAGTWSMEHDGLYYKFVYVAWVFIIPSSIFVVANFEGLFLGFCYEIKTQFMILGNMFENLNVNHIRNCEDLNVYNKQLRNNIQHHIFLITFVKELQKTYSLCFMVQCIIIAPLICTEMYAVTESTSLFVMMRYAFICIALITQFAFYCIPGSFVVDEASTLIADGIYNSDWFSKSFPQLRMPILFLIQVSRQELKFTAGNLIAINIDTLIKVVKVAFSANAVLKSIKE